MFWLSCLFFFSPRLLRVSAQDSPQDIASQFGLTTSTSLPFPVATQATGIAQGYILSNWDVSRNTINSGPENLDFVDDPFSTVNSTSTGTSSESSASSPALRVTYDNGSFTPDGGSQLYSMWTPSDGSSFQTMLLSYEIAFSPGYDWVRGGKLPGLRGGPDRLGCDGGREANGTNCFSMRLMWRAGGEGEVYAYIPGSNSVCSNPDFICDPDYGTSIQRGAFTFTTGQWDRVSMLVQLNDIGESNGLVSLYFNDVQVIQQSGLLYRNSSLVDIGGLFFSTFFGGHSEDWATPVTTYSYFRNIQMWGSTSNSSTSTSPSNSSISTSPSNSSNSTLPSNSSNSTLPSK